MDCVRHYRMPSPGRRIGGRFGSAGTAGGMVLRKLPAYLAVADGRTCLVRSVNAAPLTRCWRTGSRWQSMVNGTWFRDIISDIGAIRGQNNILSGRRCAAIFMVCDRAFAWHCSCHPSQRVHLIIKFSPAAAMLGIPFSPSMTLDSNSLSLASLLASFSAALIPGSS